MTNDGRHSHPNRATGPSTAADAMAELIEQQIFIVRGQRVMLSPDLSQLYEVEPRALVQAVKRNLDRFSEDFMFQLSQEEFRVLKSQIVISSWGGMQRAELLSFRGTRSGDAFRRAQIIASVWPRS